MTNDELLHAVVNNAHHSKRTDKEYIYRMMHDEYGIPIEQINLAFEKSLTDGTLQPDGRGGYFSTEDPAFDYMENTPTNAKPNFEFTKSVRNATEYLYWIAGIVLAIIALWQLFKR